MIAWNQAGMDRGVDRHAQDCVILLHGMFASRHSMLGLERCLRHRGYHVVNESYPSLRTSITHHAQQLAQEMTQLQSSLLYRHIHLVTHSLGGIIARCAISRFFCGRVNRMVMLAPPNAGSRLTRMPLGPLGRWFPPLVELSESPASLVNQLPEPTGVEIGVIAAAGDPVVSVNSTGLLCQRDHLLLQSSHQGLPKLAETQRQVLHFLQYGCFQRAQQFAA